MDGLLVVDKPVGPTSHDVVARVRRALREKRIGHTGTLDPMASGVLALVIGRATRLAQFLAADEKSYEARIRLGVRTDTFDADGSPIGPVYEGPWPGVAEVEAALEPFRGTYLQQPPAYSAKKIDGQRSYALARARGAAAAEPARLPAPVTVQLLECRVTAVAGALVDLTLTGSAGFYVRSLAEDLGNRLGTGAHLVALRRTRSGAASLDRACALAALEEDPTRAAGALVPMADMLPHLPAITLTTAGVTRAQHGVRLGPGDVTLPTTWLPVIAAAERTTAQAVRLLGPDGALVALGRLADGPSTRALHPSVVLM